MQHKEWQELIPFYVAQTLPPDEIRQFEVHLVDCDSCQREIEDWRMIASVVWRETDKVARELPPLSQDVYNRLNYRDKAPKSRYSTNPPVAQSGSLKIRPMPQSTRSQFPLTMVAGLVVAVLFGGLLMLIALRPSADPVEIALGTTPGAEITEQFGMGIGGGNDQPTQTPAIGIIPTLVPDLEPSSTPPAEGALVFVTNTPLPVPTEPDIAALLPAPTQNVSTMSMIVEATPTYTPSPAGTPDVPPPGGGPYITVTPGVFSGGIALCEAFNPTSMPIEVFTRADRNSEIVGVIMPGQVLTVTQVSVTGWYYLQLSDGSVGWLQSGFAYLRGNCVNSLPVATVIPTATQVIGTPSLGLEMPSEDMLVVINASFADLYTGPDFNSAVIGVAERNQQFPVMGYQGTGDNRWVLVSLTEGSQAWIWASVVQEYRRNEAPPTPTP